MANDHSKEIHDTRCGGPPLAVAIAVAALGIFGILIVDHGPWSTPHVKTAAVASTTTTGNAARDAGATVMPTESRRLLEPDAPGPKPVNPANPAPPVADF